MRFQIVKDVPGAVLASHVRADLRDFLPPVGSKEERFTLIQFRFQRDEKGSGVVTSNSVRQALRRLGEVNADRILALAGDFTLEARSLLKVHGIEVVATTCFGWTDEGYQAIKRPRCS
jgi:hypothetical protein